MNPEDQLENVIVPSKFIKEVEEFVVRTKESYIDTIIHLAGKYGIEIETAASIVKSSMVLKAKLQAEAEDLRYLPKKAKLPINDSI
jgi:hypothetical protein